MKYELLNDKCRPEKKHASDAGMDLKSSISVKLPPQAEETIPLGIKTEIPPGYCAIVVPRSGLGSNGFVLRNTVGVIDSDYRGEWMAKVKNKSENTVFKIKEGERVVQAVIVPVYLLPWIEGEITETVRGEGGFGSTKR